MKLYNNPFITWTIILLLTLFFLLSCSPTQRLARLHDKHPEIFTTATDTIQHTDTVTVHLPSVSVDTFVLFDQITNTVHIEKDGLSTKLWKRADTVFLHAKTDTVTLKVPYQVKIPVTKYITPPPKKRRLWMTILLLAVGAMVVNSFIYIRKK